MLYVLSPPLPTICNDARQDRLLGRRGTATVQAGIDEREVCHVVRPLSAELQLAIACCRFPSTDAARRAVMAALARQIDWAEFDAVVRRHRIAGLAGSALCVDEFEIPANVRKSLAETARLTASQDLLHAAETVRLQQLFDQAGIPAMFLKGVAIGILSSGRLGIKQSWDNDLRTTEPCMMEALELLERDGYRVAEPAQLPRDAFPRFARFYHEAQLQNHRGITVELHWRLFSKSVLPGVTGASATQVVSINGQAVRTLREDLLIAYLVAHGQETGWSRLKWIADLNALLARKSGDQLEALHAQAQTVGLGPKTAAALLLCAQLFELPLPARLAATLERDRAAGRLVEVSLDCISYPLTGGSIPVLSRISLALMGSRFGNGTGLRAQVGEIAALWTQPIARARYPEALDFLYHLLRIPIWLLRLPLKLYQLRRSAMPENKC
jgi:hypothetical protein